MRSSMLCGPSCNDQHGGSRQIERRRRSTGVIMFMTGIWSRLFVFMAVVAAAGIAHAEDAMDRIKQTGKLTVGIKVDYRPFGYRNEKGEMLGLEHDLVADIASRLSTKLG